MSGMDEVGRLFGAGQLIVAEVLVSAEVMQAAVDHLRPHMRGDDSAARGSLLLATVRGDVHDIGKNLVGIIFSTNGYQVVDLGKDVGAERIVREIERHRPRAVGLSALMTTTMTQMKEVIGLAREQGENCPFVVGGAVVTKAYAESIGAEYARDGVEAVQVIQRLIR
jgi:5-methyltetrahydrofolate--homocysteine methyltransferase